MPEKIGIPTTGGIKDAMVDYGVGLLGGVGYSIGASFLGSGLIGGFITAGLVGSMVKGPSGRAIATILGFQSVMGGLGANNGGSSSNEAVL